MEDSAPGCLPGLRPDLPRSDRSRGFFLYGLSEDGGFEDVEESFATSRSSSSTRAASASICASRAASCAAARSSRSAAASRSREFCAASSDAASRSCVLRLQLRYPRAQLPRWVRRGHGRHLGHKPYFNKAGDPL